MAKKMAKWQNFKKSIKIPILSSIYQQPLPMHAQEIKNTTMTCTTAQLLWKTYYYQTKSISRLLSTEQWGQPSAEVIRAGV